MQRNMNGGDDRDSLFQQLYSIQNDPQLMQWSNDPSGVSKQYLNN